MHEITKTIDIEKSIKTSNSRFLKSLPEFIIRLIIKITGQEDLNSAIYNNREKTGVPFINGILHDWNVNIEINGTEHLPASGRLIFVANHPVGGMEAMAFLSMIHRFFPDVVSPSNQLLYSIPNIRPLMLAINVFGKNTRETAKKLHELFESDTQVMIFPAGEVSRRVKGKIEDIVWQKSFITKAIQHKRDIIPVFISGKNSRLFYNVASIRKFFGIKMYVETLLLPREMLSQRNLPITFTIGKPISYQVLTEEKTHPEWAQWVKSVVYSLGEDQEQNNNN
jgi:putative hemolysin